MNIDKRIAKIEAFVSPSIPGTQFCRVVNPYPETGFSWCIGFGKFGHVKRFFYGETIDDALTQAEKHYKV